MGCRSSHCGDPWKNGEEDLSVRNHLSTLGLAIRSWERERKRPQAKTIKLDFSLTWRQLASKEKGGAGRDVVAREGRQCVQVGFCFFF